MAVSALHNYGITYLRALSQPFNFVFLSGPIRRSLIHLLLLSDANAGIIYLNVTRRFNFICQNDAIHSRHVRHSWDGSLLCGCSWSWIAGKNVQPVDMIIEVGHGGFKFGLRPKTLWFSTIGTRSRPVTFAHLISYPCLFIFLQSMCTSKRNTVTGYFLANKENAWYIVSHGFDTTIIIIIILIIHEHVFL